VLAILLGSGLGGLADRLEAATVIPYGDLPGFPALTVAGHAGRLLLGRLAGLPTAILQGRAHYYEDGKADAMQGAIAALAALGCKRLLLTCAAGSLREQAGPGSIMAVTDHINLAGISPLIGERGSGRFVDMGEAYDPGLRRRLHAAAEVAGVPLHEGVYAWFPGPQFETPAEIRAVRALGAGAVGMSLVPETILARHAGLEVAALGVITNLGAGLAPGGLDHRQTLVSAASAASDLLRLVEAFAADLRQEAAA
jgi:purine-nucleoside phosphorylase